MRFMCAFFISVPISRDKTLINCFNERDGSGLLTFFLTDIEAPSYSPVNLGFDLEQIATEMIFAGSHSLNSAS